MASNYRVIYPVEAVFIGPHGSASGVAVHGVQSVNLTTTFSLEQVFELGQLDIYANLENLPNIEMTVEKDLDGYPLVYHLATQGATANDLLNRTNNRADVFFNIYSDAQVSASGTPMMQAYCSGLYVNSLSYSLPLQGSCKETVTFVGNDKIWVSGTNTPWTGGRTGFAFLPIFNNLDSPSSGIQRRFNIQMGAGKSLWPKSLPGIDTATGYNLDQGGGLGYGSHIQDVTISCNLAREDLYELGRRRPYYRYAKFPVAVDTVINITAGGIRPGDIINANADTNNITDETITILLDDSDSFTLGTKNKLLSVAMTGGDTGGEVLKIAYNYQNFNYLVVGSATDPMHL